MFTLTRVGEPMIQLQGIPQATKHEMYTDYRAYSTTFSSINTGLPTKDDTSKTTVRFLFILFLHSLVPYEFKPLAFIVK